LGKTERDFGAMIMSAIILKISKE